MMGKCRKCGETWPIPGIYESCPNCCANCHNVEITRRVLKK